MLSLKLSLNSYHGENQKGKWLTRIVSILFHLQEKRLFVSFFFHFFSLFPLVPIPLFLSPLFSPPVLLANRFAKYQQMFILHTIVIIISSLWYIFIFFSKLFVIAFIIRCFYIAIVLIIVLFLFDKISLSLILLVWTYAVSDEPNYFHQNSEGLKKRKERKGFPKFTTFCQHQIEWLIVM